VATETRPETGAHGRAPVCKGQHSQQRTSEATDQIDYDSAVLGSGLIIEVPEAETAVAAWRERLDPQAALGVPAHITVLFPFAAPDRLDVSSIAILSRLVTTAASFEFHLARTAWFGDTTLWLAPEPPAPFKQLTELLSGAFPAYPPYAGQFAEVVPHLTIGDHGARQQFLDAERDMQQHLPINAAARAVSLMVERSDRRWERLTVCPLANSR
jgi:2'-5' RNA ligase